MHIGCVTKRPNPTVRNPTTHSIINIMIAPIIVEYNIPREPNRKVRINDRPTFLVEIVTTV
jgi:hypothetical protein